MVKRVFFGETIFRKGREQNLEAWREVGQEFGFVPVRAHEEPEVVILPNIPLLDVGRVLLNSKLRVLRRFAILSEPTIVLPHLGWGLWQKFFEEIYWLGNASLKGSFYPWPYYFPEDLRIQNSFPREGGVVFMNSNKFSMTSGELYTLRRKVIQANPNLHVYGQGWDDSPLVRTLRLLKETLIALQNPRRFKFAVENIWLRPFLYHGVAKNKVTETAKYKVALVIENSFELVTEKLFDAWLAGCIPVYVGPDLAKLGFPTSLFIASDPDLQSVQAAIFKALGKDHAGFLTELGQWLPSSKIVWNWGPERVWKSVFR